MFLTVQPPSSRFFVRSGLYVIFIGLLASPMPSFSQSVTYSVGPGQQYGTLQDLVSGGVLKNSDTVVIYGSDSSLLGQRFDQINSLTVNGIGSQQTLTQRGGLKPVWGGLFNYSRGSSNDYINLHLANLNFANNSVVSDNTTTSGRGGAIHAGGSNNFSVTLDMSGAHNISFTGNAAYGGSVGNAGLGGAIFADVMTISGSASLLFDGNTAVGGDSSGFPASNGSGQGGAVYVNGSFGFRNVSDAVFSRNTAMSGDVTASGGWVASSGIGGAIATGLAPGSTFDMRDSSNILFIDNRAIGGTDVSGGTAANNTGLGGALALLGQSFIAGASFINNTAISRDNGNLTTGLGGAIYSSTTELNLLASAGNDLLFSGNTHNPGNTGVKPNSITFGNIGNLGASDVDFTVNAGAGSYIRMYDPLASLSTFGGLHIFKKGQGSWLLGGLNDMQSATNWNIDQGTLEFVNAHGGVHIDQTMNSAGSSFTLGSAATLLVDPSFDAHRITGGNIDLSMGSVGLSQTDGMYVYFDEAVGKEIVLLKLRTNESLLNDYNNIINESGSFYSGVYKYDYNLHWDASGNIDLAGFARGDDLVALLRAKHYDDERGGSSGTTGPNAVATQNTMMRMLGDRLSWNFECLDGCGNNRSQAVTPLGYSGSRNLWIMPTFAYMNSDTRSDFSIATPGISLGIDNCFDRRYFAGMAFMFSTPAYSSRYADINAISTTLAAYGGFLLPGELELGLTASYGHVWYDQKRSVQQNRYQSEYESDQWSLGVNLARRIPLAPGVTARPFAAYEFMYLDVKGFSEEDGVHALRFASQENNLHFLHLGSELNWQRDKESLIRGKLYYAGLYGDTSPSTEVTFLRDSNNTSYTSYGDKLDRHSLGIGLDWINRVSRHTQVAAQYNLQAGAHSQSHYAGVRVMHQF